MNGCCDGGGGEPAGAGSAGAPAPLLRRLGGLGQWAVPVTTLALMPKCPLCFAGYVGLLTGLGISFSTAAAIRTSVVTLSVVAIGYLVMRAARRALASRP